TTTQPRLVSEPDKTPAGDPAVSVRLENESYRVRTPAYEAVVDKDGCLNSLRVGGVEFLHPGGVPLAGGKSVSRGRYFYSDRRGCSLSPHAVPPRGVLNPPTKKPPPPEGFRPGGKKSKTPIGSRALLFFDKPHNAPVFRGAFLGVFPPGGGGGGKKGGGEGGA